MDESSEFCERCGLGPLPPWSAPDDQWNAVTEHPDSPIENGRGAILCPQCFTDTASALYGLGIVARVELDQKRCRAHGYWPPCPDSSSYDPCRWVPTRVEFGRRLQAAIMDRGTSAAMTESRRAHLYDTNDTSRPLCGAKVRWQDSPTPDEAETCLTCDRVMSERDSSRYVAE